LDLVLGGGWAIDFDIHYRWYYRYRRTTSWLYPEYTTKEYRSLKEREQNQLPV
jgi:hypothetical protein